MRFEPTALKDVVLVRATPAVDRRGTFARLYCPDEFAAAGISFVSTQVNLSRNPRRHTLRGMHFQPAPHAESKLIRVTRGAIYDVVIDLRPGSPTFRRWISAALDADAGDALFAPEGCAHGFLTLTDDCDVLYQMGRIHQPGHAAGVRWNDPAFGVRWPAEPSVISDADRSWPDFVG
jgi:dTDP-4-dehydrorhamnose 3,5-epimerase